MIDKEWFENERGISQKTLDSFNVRVEDGTAIFPYATGERYRKQEDGKRTFAWTSGSEVSLFKSPNPAGAKTVFLCEGETDTMRLWQELGGKIPVYGLPGITTWKSSFTPEFEGVERIYIVLDNDIDYNVASRVNESYKLIRQDLGYRAHRIYLPSHTKDICEFFNAHDLDAFRKLVSSTPASRFKPLDLKAKPPPINWLVKQFICKGDVTLLMGNPGLGKSFLAMDLAVSIAEGHKTWLGMPLTTSTNRVLYIDEENPVDLIYDRMLKLGLTAKGATNLRYLHRQSIWLDRDPEEVLDEAMAFKPDLIIIDALARIHTGDENSANVMASLFRSGIAPLARDTGAAVVVIHHAVKGEHSNSFVRARGSGDISASVDSGIDVRPTGTIGKFSVSMYKSRRFGGSVTFDVKINDTKEGGVKLERMQPQGEIF